MITRQKIQDVLFLDWQCRKKVTCELINVEKVLRLGSPKFATDLFVATPYASYNVGDVKVDYIDKLHATYPHLNAILKLFKGEVYVAGGCLFRTLFERVKMDSDCDLFFVNCTKERIDEILRIVYNYLCGKHGRKCVFGVRNQNTTTFSIFEDEAQKRHAINAGTKYQFIHGRSYPSKEAIVIGFDLGTSALLYDQGAIYGTPLAIFCLYTRCNILDPSRRSTSYEARINKYGSLGTSLITLCTAPHSELARYYGVNRNDKQARHEIVRGLGAAVTRTKLRFEPYHVIKSATEQSDYGVISTCLYWMDISNARLAFKGKLDQIMWTGQREYDIFDSPKIGWSTGKAFHPDVGSQATEKLLVSWFGKKTIDALLVERYPDTMPPHWIPYGVYAHLVEPHQKLIARRIEEAQKLAAKGVSYIGPDENPGRQYTSSFNPVYSDVRDYYKKHSKITRIGIPDEVYLILKKALKAVLGCYWKDTAKLIMIKLSDMMCAEILANLLN